MKPLLVVLWRGACGLAACASVPACAQETATRPAGSLPAVAQGSFAGRVLNSLLDPVVGARVELCAGTDPRPVRTAQTDGSGEFVAGRLPLDAPLRLRIEAGGLTLLDEPQGLLTEESRDARAGEFVLYAATTLCGLVHDEAGAPIAEATVAAAGSTQLRWAPSVARSGADGRFTLEHVPFGRVTVRVKKAGYVLHEQQVVAGAERNELHASLQRGSGAELVVAFRGVDPRDLGAVRLLRASGLEPLVPPLAGEPQPDGTLRFSGLPDGRYEVQVERWDVSFDPPRLLAEAAAGRVRRVEWAMRAPEPTPTCGILKDQKGTPLARRRIVVQRPRGFPRVSVLSDEAGRFCARTPVARGEGMMLYLLDDAWQLVPDDSGRLQSAVADKDLFLELVAGPKRRVTGTVVDAQRNGIEGAYVTIFSETQKNGSDRRTAIGATYSARDGSFVSGSVTADDATLGIEVKSRLGYARVGGIPAPQSERLVIRLEPAAELSGSVRDPQGVAIAGAIVSLSSRFADARQDGATTVSDREGRFRFAGLEAGTHVLSASLGGADDKMAGELVELGAGARRSDLRLVLR